MKPVVLFSVITAFIAVLIAIDTWDKYQPARLYRIEVLREIMRHPHPHQNLYHVLPGEHCETGYLRIPHAFSRGENYWDGCWDGSHASDFTIDFMLRDEDAAIGAVVREHR